MIVLILQGLYTIKHPNEIEFKEYAYPPSILIITVRIIGITLVCLLCHR